MTDRELYVPRIFSAYVQVRDLDRSLSFYQDTLGLEIECRDGALALLRSGGDSEHTLVIRQIGDHAVRRGGRTTGTPRISWRSPSPRYTTSSGRSGSPREIPTPRRGCSPRA